MIGSIVDRKYRVDRLLGMGGTGAVYAAWHLNLERPVALKMLHAHFASFPRLVERFHHEAQVMGKLGHENFVQIIDFRYSEEGLPYLVMDLVEGETLRARLARGPLPVKQAVALFQALCEALGVAHGLGIVHRDLKPENLMFHRASSGQDGREVLKILDFGASKLLGANVPKSSAAFQPGTAFYMAPERLDDSQAADHRVDIFALGAILYEVLSGSKAFGGDTPEQAIYKIAVEPVPRLPADGQGGDRRISGALDAVIRRACAKAPGERFSSTAELSLAISAAASGAVLTPPGQGAATFLPWATPERPRPPARALPPARPLSGTPPLGAGVKQAMLLTVTQALCGLLGTEAPAPLGADFLPRLRELVLTDWVDGAELRRVFGCAAQHLGGEEGQRRLGRAFADLALDTTYRSLLVPGKPELVLRRMDVILQLWHSEGESASRRIPDGDGGGFRLLIAGLRTLDAGVAAGTAGFLERYLERAGATAVSVGCRAVPDENTGIPAWEFTIHFTGPAPEQGA